MGCMDADALGLCPGHLACEKSPFLLFSLKYTFWEDVASQKLFLVSQDGVSLSGFSILPFSEILSRPISFPVFSPLCQHAGDGHMQWLLELRFMCS